MFSTRQMFKCHTKRISAIEEKEKNIVASGKMNNTLLFSKKTTNCQQAKKSVFIFSMAESD